MTTFTLHQGAGPLLVSMPHPGTALPAAIRERLAPRAQATPDTDWHLDRLYDFAAGLGASVLRATQSRYVIDLNRPPDDASLYPGRTTTDLCPLTDFDGVPLYLEGRAPGAAEVAQRRAAFWQPYHDALHTELGRIAARHGYALLYDAHSIRSVVPRLFDGVLPDLNLGTDGGRTAAPSLIEAVAAVCRSAPGFTFVADGRFRGGYITRHYGRPEDGIHAIQMELAQYRYMDESPSWTYQPGRAALLKGVLRSVLGRMLEWRPDA
jgi:N-formylglutamate deformylase